MSDIFENVPEIDLFPDLTPEVKKRLDELADAVVNGDLTMEEVDKIIEELDKIIDDEEIK